jgi:hypothetical protein
MEGGTVRGILKFIFGLPGLILDLAGFIGLFDDSKKLNDALAIFSGVFDNPYIYVPALLGGTVLLGLAIGEGYAEHKIRKAGGATGREFPVRLKYWDAVREFPVWQIAWLWNDLEPQPSDQKTEGTPAYPTFRMLKEDLSAGMISGARPHQGSWLWTTLDRQSLVDYAYDKDHRPKFLFPEVRQPSLLRMVMRLLRNEFPWRNRKVYEDYGTFESRMEMAAQEAGLGHDDVWRVIQHWFESGKWEAIGRRKKGGVAYHYERISSRQWKHMRRDFGGLRLADQLYVDVRVRQTSGKAPVQLDRSAAAQLDDRATNREA